MVHGPGLSGPPGHLEALPEPDIHRVNWMRSTIAENAELKVQAKELTTVCQSAIKAVAKAENADLKVQTKELTTVCQSAIEAVAGLEAGLRCPFCHCSLSHYPAHLLSGKEKNDALQSESTAQSAALEAVPALGQEISRVNWMHGTTGGDAHLLTAENAELKEQAKELTTVCQSAIEAVVGFEADLAAQKEENDALQSELKAQSEAVDRESA